MKFIMNQEQENASKFIIEQVKKYPNEIKIVSIGIVILMKIKVNR